MGVNRRCPTVSRALRAVINGLTWADVEQVCAYAEMDGSVAGLRDSTLIRLMSDCLLRVSEAVAVNVGDLKDKTLLAKSSKTDQEGIGEALYITGDTRRIINRYRERYPPLIPSSRRIGL